METLRKPLAVILGLTAFAVLFHFVLSPFYEDVVESDDVWNVLNWFMALAVIVALVIDLPGQERRWNGQRATPTRTSA